MSAGRRTLLFGCAAIGLAAAVAVVGLGAVTYLAALSSSQTAIAEVSIWSPTIGSMASVGQSIMVQVESRGPVPFATINLWIDGQPAGADEAPTGGIEPWTTVFHWTPSEEGQHTLFSSAVDLNGVQTFSEPVIVQVEGDVISTEHPEDLVFPAASAGQDNQAEGMAGHTGSQPWPQGGSIGQRLEDFFFGSEPHAPQLALQTSGCDVQLDIFDLADNEDGFTVYRQIGSAWQPLAELPANPGTGDLAHELPGQSGEMMLYVTAHNAVGESPSNPVTVKLPEPPCSPAAPSPASAWSVQLESFQPAQAVDQAYCYRSYGGLAWARWPEQGFMSPEADPASLPGSAFLPAQDADNGAAELDFILDCWGWAQGSLIYLGRSSPLSIFLDQAATLPLHASGFTADVGIKTYDGTGSLQASSDQFPYIFAWVDYRREECLEHLPNSADHKCHVNPGFNDGPQGPNPQPYILWEYREGVCPAGNDTCLATEWLVLLAKDAGYKPIIEVVEVFDDYVEGISFGSEGPYFTRQFRYEVDPGVPAWVPVNWACQGDREYKVRLAFFSPITGESTLVGPYSNTVHGVTCHTLPDDEIWLEATFHNLLFSQVDDCDPVCEDTIEVSGGFSALTSTSQAGDMWVGLLHLGGCINNPPEPGIGECSLFTHSMGVGNHLLNQFRMCYDRIDTPGRDCDDPNTAQFIMDNNRIAFPVQDGAAVRLNAHLSDDDNWSGKDQVCFTSRWTPQRSLQEWASIGTETYLLRQLFAENGNADCRVDVTLHVLDGPP
jgi:hypothetical protein